MRTLFFALLSFFITGALVSQAYAEPVAQLPFQKDDTLATRDGFVYSIAQPEPIAVHLQPGETIQVGRECQKDRKPKYAISSICTWEKTITATPDGLFVGLGGSEFWRVGWLKMLSIVAALALGFASLCKIASMCAMAGLGLD